MYGLNLEITNKCNLNCKHCGVIESCTKKENDNLSELSLQQYKDLINKAKELGCKHIIIAGGEPLVREDFFDICDFINDLEISFSILTNGILINDHSAARLSKYKYLSYVRISFDYYSDEKFSSFRGIPNIRSIIENSITVLRKNNIKVGIGMTLMDDNLEDIRSIAELSRKLGANFFRAVPVMPIGKSKDLKINNEFYSNALMKMMEVAQDLQSEYFTTLFLPDNLKELDSNIVLECPGGDQIIAIDAYGYVKRCPISTLKMNESVLEKDFKLLFEEIKNKTRLEKKAITNNAESNCNKCENCSACKGGCFAERELRNASETDVNPICVKSMWDITLDKVSVTPKLRRLINNMMCIYTTQSFHKMPMCHRSSPLWWFNL